MKPQNNSYIAKPYKISNDRYVHEKGRLGNRAITTNIIDGKRYFSSLDAEIYIGGTKSKFIDELLQITWSIEQATLPLFGYNSYTFDDLAVGARQISGNFVINFTSSGYLYDVLRGIDGVNRASFYENIPPETNLKWQTRFEKEHTASWDKSFNIIIGYGDQTKNGINTSMVLIHCVQLMSCQQLLSIDGTPIAESYSFIAKDIRYDNSTALDNSTQDDTTGSIATSPPEAVNTFVFSPGDITLERIENKKNYIDEPKFGYILHFSNPNYINGIPIDISITFSDESNSIKSNIKNKFFEAKELEKIIIPSYSPACTLTLDLEKIYQKQKEEKTVDPYVYVSIVINYKKNDNTKINSTFTLSKQKANIIFSKV